MLPARDQLLKVALTDSYAWQALAQNCSGLQYLNVGWCEQITDVGVTALALGCRDLRFIDFCGCLQITGMLLP